VSRNDFCYQSLFSPCSPTLFRQVTIFPIGFPYLGLTFVPASTYFHLPIDEDEDEDIEKYERKYLTWVAEPSGSSTRPLPTNPNTNHDTEDKGSAVVNVVLANDDLYEILGVSKYSTLDKITLRRAYLSRSKACHPESVFRSFYTPQGAYLILQ